MILSLTDKSNEPLHSQIFRQLREKILAGELPSGSNLPSIRQLARSQHISVITVQRAYNDLELEGLVETRRGKGFFVVELSEVKREVYALSHLREALVPVIEEAVAQGLEPHHIEQVLHELLANKKIST